MTTYGPHHDIICSLLKKPFADRTEMERADILMTGRPTPSMKHCSQIDQRHGQTFQRSFQTQWYAGSPWLCGSFYKQGMFCWPCILFNIGRNNYWVTRGQTDLKNMSAMVRKHEALKEHMSNYLALKRYEKDCLIVREATEKLSGLSDSLSLKLFNEDVRLNRLLVSYLIDVTCHLAKQQVSNSADNFRDTFNLLIKRDMEIQKHLNKIDKVFSPFSENVQNVLIGCVTKHLRKEIFKEINEALYFSIQVDDATDIFEKSQCSMSVRYVNTLGIIKVRFLGFFDVGKDRTADAMYAAMTSVLRTLDFKNDLVAQSYDGASITEDSLDALQKRIKQDAVTALFTHSTAHRFEQVLQQGTKNLKNCRVFLASLTSMSSFFFKSSRRMFILDSVLNNRISSGSNTNWASRTKLIVALESEWDSLRAVFEHIIEDNASAAESINEAKGYLNLMDDLEFAFLTVVYKNIFDLTDSLSTKLKKRSLEVTYCKSQAFMARDRIKAMKVETKFNALYENAERKISSGFEETPHKKSKLAETAADKKTFLQILFYDIIDNVVAQINMRCADMPLMLYFALADYLNFQMYANDSPGDLITLLTCAYKSTFDKQKLTNELNVIYSDKQFCDLSIEKLLTTFVESDLRDMFSEAYKLFVLVATIPATNTSVDKNGSCLKRIKAFSKNYVKNDRMASLALLSIEKELLCLLQSSDDFTDEIINKFALSKVWSIDLMYKQK